MLALERIPVKLVLFVAVINGDLINFLAGLYPQESESQIIVDLAGIWNFQVSADPDQGFTEKWYMQPLSEVIFRYTPLTNAFMFLQTGPVVDMPVPSSYNDITEDHGIN